MSFSSKADRQSGRFPLPEAITRDALPPLRRLQLHTTYFTLPALHRRHFTLQSHVADLSAPPSSLLESLPTATISGNLPAILSNIHTVEENVGCLSRLVLPRLLSLFYTHQESLSSVSLNVQQNFTYSPFFVYIQGFHKAVG